MNLIFSRILIFACSLMSFTSSVNANSYLQIRFSSNAVIATSTTSGDSLLLNFNDPNLDNIFSGYRIMVYTKDYPSIASFSGSAVDTLLRVYRISTSGNVSTLLSQINSTNSSDLDNAYMIHDPILLYEPNDYITNFSPYPDVFEHLNLINAKSAWDVTRGLECIKVGIIDTRFITHNELNNKVTSVSPYTQVISAGNYYTIVTSAGTFTLDCHGTNVAGFVGAETENGSGIASLGNKVKLGYYNFNRTYDAMIEAAADGCNVLNLSWWDGDWNTTMIPPNSNNQGVINFIHSRGVTIVAAAGNNDTGTPTDFLYPASYNHVISVTSVGSHHNVGDISTTNPNGSNWKDVHRHNSNSSIPISLYNKTHQHNTRVDISAPGIFLSTTAYDNNFNSGAGTSFSAPLVAAAAALIYSLNPSFMPDQVKAFLMNNTSNNLYSISDNNLWTGKLGTGRLDAAAALNAAASLGCQPRFSHLKWSSGSSLINKYDCWNYKKVDFGTSTAAELGQTVYWEFRYYDGTTYHSIFKTGSTASLTFGVIGSGSDVEYPRNPRAPLQCLYNLEVYVRQGIESNCCVSAYYKEESGTNLDCSIYRVVKTNFQAISTDKIFIEPEVKVFELYPSPAQNELKIAFQQAIKKFKKTTYEIINSEGKVVKAGTLQNSNSTLDISILQKGFYIFKINQIKPVHKKFIKVQ